MKTIVVGYDETEPSKRALECEVALGEPANEMDAGTDLTPRPFLRGLLLTGAEPRYLRQEVTGGFGETSWASPEPLW